MASKRKPNSKEVQKTSKEKATPTHSQSLSVSSESAFDLYCNLCDREDRHLEAAGFCSDCEEYLCQECYNTHLKPKPMRHHVLLNKDKMPSYLSPRQQKQDMCTEPCKVHKKKTIKYYCGEHAAFGCSVCMTLQHRNCEGVDYIPDVADKVTQTAEYKDMDKKIQSLTQEAQKAIQKTQVHVKDTDTQQTNAVQTFKQLRKDTIQALDRIEATILKDVEKVREEDKKKLKSIEDHYKAIVKKKGDMESKFKALQNKGQLWQIYILMKNSKSDIACMEQSLLTLENENTITSYSVKVDNNLQTMITQPQEIAKLEITKDSTAQAPVEQMQCQTSKKKSDTASTVSKVNKDVTKKSDTASTVSKANKEEDKVMAKYVGDITVKGKDEHDTWITGFVILPKDKLVVVDDPNNKVKLIDVKGNKVVASLQCSEDLWDITTVTSSQVAVTSPNGHKIFFVNVNNNKLALNDTVKVKGKCWGIASMDDKLVVTFSDPIKVEIYNRYGKLLQTVITDLQGRQLFSSPDNVALSPDKATLYISDSERNTVTCFGLNGHYKATYDDEELDGPKGLAVGKAGKVYVCGSQSHNIHELGPDLSHQNIILREPDGVWLPSSMDYCGKTNRLYVNHTDAVIKVFQLL